MLNTIVHGSQTDAPPLVIAHGLYGSARNWGVIAKRLADTRQVIAVDMRNHGDSPHFDTHRYDDMADDLAKVIDANGGRADVLGHSMGGKAAMVLALTRPDHVNRLIVVDMAPIAYEHDQHGPLNAMRSVDLTHIETRKDAGAQMDASPEVIPFLLQSLDLRNRRWMLNLDALAVDMDQIVGWPAIDARFDGPVLALRGATSDYVDQAGQDALRHYFPNIAIRTIKDAGHWIHAEQPRAVEEALRTFLVAD